MKNAIEEDGNTEGDAEEIEEQEEEGEEKAARLGSEEVVGK